MNVRAMRFLVPALLFCHAPGSDASAIASGRNWHASIDSIECDAAESRIMIGTRIRYLGPSGAAEAPVSQLVDRNGKPYLPRSLVWKSGSKQLAAWLSAGGLRNVQSGDAGEMQLRFEVRDADGDLKFEFGDIKAFSLTRARTASYKGICENLLQPGQIQATQRSRPARVEITKPGLRVFRDGYPCVPASRRALKRTEAQYPPYPPEQLLVFGRGYLPNARQIELPMGRAAAQSYAYAGLDDLNAFEDAARRAIVADFPEYGTGLKPSPDGRSKYFAFNWGAQKAASGNEMVSIGIYAVRPCPR